MDMLQVTSMYLEWVFHFMNRYRLEEDGNVWYTRLILWNPIWIIILLSLLDYLLILIGLILWKNICPCIHSNVDKYLKFLIPRNRLRDNTIHCNFLFYFMQ